jgi:RNA polymerase sigma-70 factor (ECF subfamily)
MTAAEFNHCVDKHADGVFRFVLKNLRDEENARDIVQEVFARMWEKAGQIDFAKSKSYLFTAAYHTMIDTIRRNGRFTSLENYEHMAFEPKNYTGIRKTLEEALAKLPPAQRAVVMLRDYEGYSYHEISEITGLSESQVKVYIYRARTALKNYLVTVDNLL